MSDDVPPRGYASWHEWYEDQVEDAKEKAELMATELVYTSIEGDADPSKVDVDPALFGEFPDEDVEVTPEYGHPVVDDEQLHEWERETMLARQLEFCPICDGPVEINNASADGSKVRIECLDCEHGWLYNDDGDAGKI